MKHISVVVPFHGAEPHLARCLDSLFVQRYPTWRREIIFVDNGATDEACAVVERQSSFQLIREPGPGPCAARNAGVAVARGEIIAFTDADCAVAPDWLESIDIALSDPEVMVAVGSYIPSRDSFTASALTRYENEKNLYVFNSEDESLYYGYTNNMAVRASAFDEIGPFPLRRRGSDVMFVRSVVERFGRECVRYVPEMAVRHLEVRGALDYYRKLFEHSRNLRALEPITRLRPLEFNEQMDAFSRTVRGAGYNPVGAGALFALLGVGMLFRKAGALVPGHDVDLSGDALPARRSAPLRKDHSDGENSGDAGWSRAV
ncbi:MAG: glycosyltransferase family A protein [Gemmatimonadota bacterium]|jgi:glycosyltransferase involved in cell wall biosynthesis